MTFRKLGAVLALLGVWGCASTHLAPLENQKALELQEDERQIWRESKEEEVRINRSALVYEDPRLDGYISGIVQKLAPQQLKTEGLILQVKVIKSPLLNAFTYPNGTIYVYTGILAKMDNEAQLATLLGHEMTHAMHRHAIENIRHLKSSAAFLSSFQTILMPLGILGIAPALLGSIGAMASVSGYSKDSETEADVNGLKLMVQAGYDPQEASKLFEHLKRDVEEQKQKEPFFFGNHPRLVERIANYTKLDHKLYSDKRGIVGTEIFEKMTLPLLVENSMLDLSAARYESALQTLEKLLRIEPESVEGHYYLAELHRQRHQEGDWGQAEQNYRLAIQYQPSHAESHKGLGLLYLKKSRYAEAKAEFEQYLAYKPDAQDKEYISQYLQQIQAQEIRPK